MVPEMGGFLKTFRCIVAALLSESTVGNLSLLTELILHRHVYDIFCFERSAAVFKIAAFAIACHLVCRVMVDAATPCATGSFMVFLHWFELFGMKILTIVAKCCHQHERKEHHSHHDHWSNNEVAVGTTEVQNMAGHAGHLINSKLQCSQPSQPWFIAHTKIKRKMLLPLEEYPSRLFSALWQRNDSRNFLAHLPPPSMIFFIFFHRAIQGAKSMSRAISKKHTTTTRWTTKLKTCIAKSIILNRTYTWFRKWEVSWRHFVAL